VLPVRLDHADRLVAVEVEEFVRDPVLGLVDLASDIGLI